MNISIEFTSLYANTSQTSIPEPTNDHNKTLVIILSVALPILGCIVLITLSFIFYRRRQTKLWLKKLENSSRLQSFGTSQPQYSKKKQRLYHLQYRRPRTETIVYNQLSSPSIPVVNNSTKGETNAAFEEYLIKNEQDPTTLKTNFPTSVQTPVPTITSAFVEAIAAHRLSLLIDANNTSLEIPTSPSTVHNSQHSVASSTCSNTPPPPPPTLLLFSQRTLF